ncbi:PAS domain-containing sensor histidine kinase [Calothrix sp. NIES-2098]|uniref:PAS domain-containing sensor histidine kinase n=1 Tax=Calothrix sp. NIES-2098 TaxID=1954171 RepID=UPI000B5E5A3D|nr:integral membrane sensor signal transduction histidine kinase [Calothrix sp. NIES-2098]
MIVNSLDLPLTMFTALANRADLLMALTDRSGRIQWVNEALAKRAGITAEMLIGKKFFSVLTSNAPINIQQAYIREQLLKGESFKFELSYFSPQEKEHWLLVDGQPIHNAEGITSQYAVMANDITLRKYTEQDLEQTRQRLKRLVESVKLVPWEAEAITHQFTYVGPQVIDLFGYDLEDWYQPEFWHSHIYPEDLPRVIEYHEAISQAQDDYIVEYRLLTADGRWVWVKDIVNVVRSQGKVTQLLGFIIDISDAYRQAAQRKQTELSLQEALSRLEQAKQELETRVQQRTIALSQEKEKLEQTLKQLQQTQSQLIQSEKMSSLGQLVAGVAHEINNPVNFIYGNITPATEYVEDLLYLLQCYQQHYPISSSTLQAEIEHIDIEFIIEDLPRLLSSMKVGANRIREIVLSLRTFSRLDEAEVKEVNIHDGIDSTLMILQNRLKPKTGNSQIQVIKEYGKLPLVECYAGQLNQVFMNIIVNAIDALEEYDQKRSPQEIIENPSQITICTEFRQGETRIESAEEPHSTNSESSIVIRIIDNGPGISEAVCNRLFDPFFTTKSIGKGTGLGLSISYQIIVERHQGQIECYSTPGHTEFAIVIPQQQIKTKI